MHSWHRKAVLQPQSIQLQHHCSAGATLKFGDLFLKVVKGSRIIYQSILMGFWFFLPHHQVFLAFQKVGHRALFGLRSIAKAWHQNAPFCHPPPAWLPGSVAHAMHIFQHGWVILSRWPQQIYTPRWLFGPGKSTMNAQITHLRKWGSLKKSSNHMIFALNACLLFHCYQLSCW